MAFITKQVYSEPTQDYHQYACNLRGSVLHYVAEIERMIDDYICSHFCYNLKKRGELMEVIVATKFMTYQAKVDILKHLLLKRKDVDKKIANKMHHVLTNEIGVKRNMIAHCELDASITSIVKWETDPETVYFTKYAYEKNTEPFGKKEFIALLELISAVKSYLMTLKGKRVQTMVKRLRRRNPFWPAKQTK
jgi:hypothetical protein